MNGIIRKIKIFYHHWMAVGFENHTDHIAIKHVLSLSELEDDWGLHELGHRHSQGKSVVLDYEKAVFYFNKAYLKNGQFAKNSAARLGTAYLAGEGVETNKLKASQWFKIAAGLGDTVSQYNYGLSLLDGWAEHIDKKQGIYWLEQAASSNLKEAQKVLNAIQN